MAWSRSTSIPSGILIYPTVWPQDRQTYRQTDRQTDSILRTFLQAVAQPVEIQTLSSLTLMTHVDFCCGLLLRNLLQQQNPVRIPRQNAAATKRATNMTSSDTDDDGILNAGVLLSAAVVSECKKKLISSN